MTKLGFVALLCLWDASGQVLAQQSFQSEGQAFKVVTVTQGLEFPWCVAFLPDGRMLLTERPGRLRLIEADGRLHKQAIRGVPEVVARGQGGLFDVALHPDFAKNRWIYLSYSEPGEGGQGTALMRAKFVEGEGGARLEEQRVLFRMQPKSGTNHHFGGRIVFDRAGYVYLTLGDRGDMDRAQKPNDHAGSTIRLHDDGRVPVDNPFVKTEGAKPEKYTLGQRNIQGATLHPKTGAVWTHEHGPQGGDEVNVIRAGANYGWPVVTYGVNYVIGTKIGEGTSKPGMTQPLHYWTPSIAPSGMAFYEGDRFPKWRGNLFVGALKDQMLVRLQLDDEKVLKEERLLKNVVGRIRDVRSGPRGDLYLLIDDEAGRLLRIEPVGG
ncbi:MAG TPA: PQQ-dependent sugar dehydrogenase [Burkholderiales bacterium]|nr:PQQ-dependent sugar dehydrogenase [Burkholderiales bacterium]